jgi:Holliday junction resolvase RusA-like endonuclease
VLPWEPWPKTRPRISAARPGKAPRTHQDPEDKKAEDRTREFLRIEYAGPVLTTNVRLSVFFFRSSRQVVDLDNLVKHLEDAATGVLWVNDCQVTAFGPTELHLDREHPRTHLWVEPHTDASLLRSYDPDTGKARPV